MTARDLVKLLGWLAVAGVIAIAAGKVMARVEGAATRHLP